MITAFRAAIALRRMNSRMAIRIAETGHLALFRNGVRLAAVVATTIIMRCWYHFTWRRGAPQ
jgi:hypothetical protein